MTCGIDYMKCYSVAMSLQHAQVHATLYQQEFPTLFKSIESAKELELPSGEIKVWTTGSVGGDPQSSFKVRVDCALTSPVAHACSAAYAV